MNEIIVQAIKQIPDLWVITIEKNMYECFDKKCNERIRFKLDYIEQNLYKLGFKYTYEGPKQRVRGSCLCILLKKNVEDEMRKHSKYRLHMVLKNEAVRLDSKVIVNVEAFVKGMNIKTWLKRAEWKKYACEMVSLIPFVLYLSEAHLCDKKIEKWVLFILSIIPPLAFIMIMIAIITELKEHAEETVGLKKLII